MIKQIVKLKADTNYCPVPYVVMSATVGSADTSTYLWLKTVGYGIPLVADLNSIKAKYEANNPTDPVVYTALVGTKNAFTVATLSAVEEYSSPERLVIGEKNIGTFVP